MKDPQMEAKSDDIIARLKEWSTGRDPSLLKDILKAQSRGGQRGAEGCEIHRVVFRLLKWDYNNSSGNELLHPLAGPVMRLRLEQGGDDPKVRLGGPWVDTNAAVASLFEKRDPNAGWDRSRTWARLAALIAPDPCAMKWLATALGLFPREHWVPAAVELAALCTGPISDTEYGKRLLHQFGGSLHEAPESLEFPRRHLFVVGALVARHRAGDFDKWRDRYTQESVKMKNIDQHDLSAIADAFAHGGFLLEASVCLTHFIKKFPDVLNYQVMECIRLVLTQLGNDAPADLWNKLLSKPHPSLALEQFAACYYEGVVTFRWLRESNNQDRIDQLRGGCLEDVPEVLDSLNVKTMDWLSRTRSAIAAMTPENWGAQPAGSKAAVFVRLMVLLEDPCCHGLLWVDVVGTEHARWLHPECGSVLEASPTSLCKLASERDLLFDRLIHQHVLPLADIVRTRWRQSSRVHGKWVVKPHVTNHAASHIARDIATAKGDPQKMARLVLEVIATDAPRWDTDLLPWRNESDKSKDKDRLWATVLKKLPRLDWKSSLEGVANEHEGTGLHILAAMEDQRFIQEETSGNESKIDAVQQRKEGAVGDKERRARLDRCDRENRAILRYFSDCPLEGREKVVSSIRLSSKAVMDVVMSEPIQTPTGMWFFYDEKSRGGKELPLANPREFQAWWGRFCVKAAQVFYEAANVIEEALQRTPGRKKERDDAIERIKQLGREDVLDSACPVVSHALMVKWKAGLAGLRLLAEPLPWHVEATLDPCILQCEKWITEAACRYAPHVDLMDAVSHGINSGAEDSLVAVLRIDRPLAQVEPEAGGIDCQSALLDKSSLERVGVFYLDRLDFCRASRVRKLLRDRKGNLPSAFAHYWPVVSGLIAAPMQTIGTDKIYAPVLESIAQARSAPSFWCLCGFLIIACLGGLLFEVRRRLPGHAWTTVFKRSAMPLALLLLLNVAVNSLMYLLSKPELKSDPGPKFTILIWSCISLYLGLIIGLIAQGKGIDRRGNV